MTETEPETYTNKSAEAAKWRGVKWTGAKSRFRAYVVPATLPIRDVTVGYYNTAEEAAREHDRQLVARQIFTPANFPELMPPGWVEEFKRREVTRRSKLEAVDSQPVAPTPEPAAETTFEPTPELEVIEQVDRLKQSETFMELTGEPINPPEEPQAGILEDIKQQAAIIVVVIEATKRYKPDRIVAALEEILGKFKGAKAT